MKYATAVISLMLGAAVAQALYARETRPAPATLPQASAAIPAGPIDPAVIATLLKKFGVPGVSIAVATSFRIEWARGYGIADVEAGQPVTPGTMFQAASISKPVAAMVSLRAVQDGLFSLDQDVNAILKSWKLPGDGFTKDRPVTPRGLMSHTAGTGDAFGFPGYAPGAPLPTLPQMLDGLPPSNRRPVRLERPPLTGFEYSGGGVMIQQLALSDAVARPFERVAREWVLDPLGMADSTFEQPLPAARVAQAARAHSRTGARMGDPWHVYPEQAAAGLWTTPSDLLKFLIEVQTTVAADPNISRTAKGVLGRATMLEMVTPVGVGPFAVGFGIEKEGEGWYFAHGGSNWGFRASVIAHRLKGYALAIMSNGDNGSALIAELERLIHQAYAWDIFDKPIPRSYGPVR
jgi:CubicO group peptidase (beta-lactamase class C family)